MGDSQSMNVYVAGSGSDVQGEPLERRGQLQRKLAWAEPNGTGRMWKLTVSSGGDSVLIVACMLALYKLHGCSSASLVQSLFGSPAATPATSRAQLCPSGVC